MTQHPDEKTYVEIPFIEQLKGMGWDHVEGDIDVPYLTERESFRDVLLTSRLRKAIKKINLDDEKQGSGLLLTMLAWNPRYPWNVGIFGVGLGGGCYAFCTGVFIRGN
jgi:hypothetical protein